MTIPVAGSSGLIGREAFEHVDTQGHAVFKVDKDMRRVLFGAQGDSGGTWRA